MTLSPRLSLWTAIAFLASACGSREPGPLAPEDALRTFRVADGFRIELFAAEPHVVDPVEIAFDEHGGVYVAELLDNPDDPVDGGPPESRIAYLEDTDGDGAVDLRTVFADRLLAVEGVAPWKGGVIATVAPDILYLKDTDGDRKADVRETLYTGFPLAHVETRISNPRLGIDNWFYVANYGNAGAVTSPARPAAPAVNIRNREFRFHPLQGVGEASTGKAQFGHAYNERGHWFVTHNTLHLQHTVIPPGYLRRNPLLPAASTLQDVYDRGSSAPKVFPISRPQQWRIDRTEARRRRYAETKPDREEQLEGYFTAASGTAVYEGDAFPASLAGAVFVGEGNGNLVHCDLLEPDGPSYSASRWPADSEFLASTDSWFRPVNLANAPDGNLYVVDYYRQYLEHPDFIPDSVKRRLKMDFRAGDKRGRIYRIVPEASDAAPRPASLGEASTEALVDAVEHPNGWHRRTAHRLLVERQDPDALPALRALAKTGARAEIRLHALWVLEGTDSLDEALVRDALADPHPAVRENGLRLAEALLPGLSSAVIRASRDEDPRVAFQAVLTVGSLPSSREVIGALADALARFPDDPWFQRAVLSAPPEMALPVLTALVERHPDYLEPGSRIRASFARDAARIVGARRMPAELGRLLKLVAGAEALRSPDWKVAALDGMAEGLSLGRGRVASASQAADLDPVLADPSVDVRLAAAAVARYFDLAARVREAVATALDPRSPSDRLLFAARLLSGGAFGDVSGALAALLRRKDSPDAQRAAARSLGAFAEPGAADILIGSWEDAGSAQRAVFAEILIRRRSHAANFVEAVADGRIRPEDIPAVTRIRMSQHPDEAVRQSAAAWLAAGARDRDAVVQEHMPALELTGGVANGRAVFDRECSNCHLARASRGRIGPDLSGVSNRSREDLLTSILDPGYAIEERYRNHLLTTRDGRFYDGILIGETAATVTLRAEAGDVSVLKEDIEEMRRSDVSLMPEGLEDGLTQQDLADLIAFLQAGL